MDERGDPYTGFLYAGLVLTEDGPQVLEFNCRLGDPEAQVVLPRLEDDLVGVMLGALDGRPARDAAVVATQAAVDVVLASAGYPDAPAPAIAIRRDRCRRRPRRMSSSSTPRPRETPRRPLTAGGRVLNIVGLGDDLAAARRRAYEAVDLVRFPGMSYRTDIGAPASPWRRDRYRAHATAEECDRLTSRKRAAGDASPFSWALDRIAR